MSLLPTWLIVRALLLPINTSWLVPPVFTLVFDTFASERVDPASCQIPSDLTTDIVKKQEKPESRMGSIAFAWHGGRIDFSVHSGIGLWVSRGILMRL
jgi:hypothetical protein